MSLTRTTIVLLACVALVTPVAVGSASQAPTARVIVEADAPTLERLMNDDRVDVRYHWPDLDRVAATVPGHLVSDLRADADLTVEMDRAWSIACHSNGNDNKGCDGGGGDDDDGGSTDRVATPSDQTPYGIEQIYDDSTVSATSGGNGVVLGHIDTGIDTDHIDLVNRIVFADGEDGNGHGTHTAGTAAADAGSDGLGIFGVAPEASIRSYKVCNNGGLCFTSDIVNAIDDCTNSGNRKCDVITFSIGGDSESSSQSDAIQAFVDAGGLFVAAAGNDGPSIGSIDFPAALDSTVAVAAIDDTKTVPDFSSRGDDDGNCGTSKFDVDFAAAGVSVESTWNDGAYNSISGTSMATPHVAGLGLKEWGGDGATTYSNIASSVEDITSGQHAASGCDPASGQGLPHVG